MTIQTKFKPGDIAWIMYDNRITQAGVCQIVVQVDLSDAEPQEDRRCTDPDITYHVVIGDDAGRRWNLERAQHQMFLSARELCDALLAGSVALNDPKFGTVAEIKI